MNYIELINNVWELREQGILSAHEADLYLYLVHRSNTLGWKNPFNQSTEVICAVLGVNRNGLTNRRNKLQQLGLIKFREGVTKTKSAQYELLCIQKDTQPYTEHDTQPYTQCDTEHDTLHKTKQNKTKLNKKDTPLPPEGENPKVESLGKLQIEKKERFKPPSADEAIQFFTDEKKISKDSAAYFAERFINFYESKNWLVGKAKMTNWKSAATRSLEWEDKRKTKSALHTGTLKTNTDRW